jgi:putative PEP-CTERM system TPR-repeat lipoprotein
LAVAAILTACGEQRADDLVISAKSYLAKDDASAAVIQLKTALQRDPKHGEARFLLGKVALDNGDAAMASVELRKALNLKFSTSEVVPQLAKSLVSEGKFKAATDEFSGVSLAQPRAQALLKTWLATGYRAQGDAERAQGALQAAFLAVPDYPQAILVQARMKAEAKKFDEAASLVDKVLVSSPQDAEAWHLKGEFLLFGKGDPTGAMTAYRKALTIDPRFLPALWSEISLLVAQRDVKGAAPLLEQLRKLRPNHPQTLYFQAQLALLTGDFKQARDLTQQLLKATPDDDRILTLAGAIEFNTNSLLQATNYLTRAVQLSPGSRPARRLLVQTLLRSNEPGKALSALQPWLAASPDDADANALAGQAYWQSGNLAQAEASFGAAASVNPNDFTSRTALALAHLATGKGDAALDELRIVSSQDRGTYADLALVSAYVRKQDYEGALKALAGVETKQPDKPFASSIRGRIQLLRKDVVQARRSFEQSLAIDPAYMPAVVALALLDVNDNKPELAQKRFEVVIAANPRNVDALLALAGLRERAGGSKADVVALLVQAVNLHPTETAPRQALITRRLTDKDLRQALSDAQAAVAAIPDSLELLETLGRTQLAAGEPNQAIVTFNRLVGLRPELVSAYMGLATAQLAAKDPEAASRNFKRALAINPDLLEAQQSLVDIEIAARRPAEALRIARAVQAKHPAESVGYIFEGNARLAQRDMGPAESAFRTALKKGPSTAVAAKLFSVLLDSGKTPEAQALADSWRLEHPKDLVFLRYIAQMSLSGGHFAMAEAPLRAMIELEPDNAAALNNLAWAIIKSGKPGAAAFAQRAMDLKPDNPAFMDTLATALLAEGGADKAVKLQEKAVALGPEQHTLRLNLAKMYLATGNKSAARAELERLGKLGSKFSEQPQVMRLLSTL